MGLVERERVVAEPVGSLPEEGYMRLYREAAREYGFGEDWYVLAAIGRVESGHGRDMGSSAAGALGPMQFLPSTWLRAGVDGDGDGVANIMDPEDAIPAAARYLRDAGAPGDWYAALYAYNHAGWYVRQVLAVAEGYRLLAGDREAGPYI
ncbi:MAG: lytic transglycosylase domain-containing protein [Rubrobacter sp.]|nr:lytic transglycosylase domain-containing protein [Rubrobacter sp.]